VLNTLIEHDLQGAFKKIAEGLGKVDRLERDYFEDNGGQ
jgi:hypothetical protein